MIAANDIVAPTLSYENARELIGEGDLISIMPNDNNLLHRLTQFITKSDYYHSGIAVWLYSTEGTKRLFICEAVRGGRRLVPLSFYATHKFDVIKCPVPFPAIEWSVLEKVAKVAYGFLDYVAIGVRILFGYTMPDYKGEVCSEFVEKTFALGGFEMPPYVLSPGELSRYLLSNGCTPRVYVR